MNRDNGYSYQNLKEMARCRRTWRNQLRPKRPTILMPPSNLQIYLWPHVTLSWSWNLIVSRPRPVDHLCLMASKLVCSFSKYRVHKFVNERTNKRTNQWMDKGHIENFMVMWKKRHIKYLLMDVGLPLLSRRSWQRERLSASVVSICSLVSHQNAKKCYFLKN